MIENEICRKIIYCETIQSDLSKQYYQRQSVKLQGELLDFESFIKMLLSVRNRNPLNRKDFRKRTARFSKKFEKRAVFTIRNSRKP